MHSIDYCCRKTEEECDRAPACDWMTIICIKCYNFFPPTHHYLNKIRFHLLKQKKTTFGRTKKPNKFRHISKMQIKLPNNKMHILFGINCKTNTHENSSTKKKRHPLNLLLDAFYRKCTYLVWEPTNLAATWLNSFFKPLFFLRLLWIWIHLGALNRRQQQKAEYIVNLCIFVSSATMLRRFEANIWRKTWKFDWQNMTNDWNSTGYCNRCKQ